jgi:hypothetical protein
MSEVAVMKDTAAVDYKASDSELIALLRGAQEELEAHGELNQANLLLRDFAKELLRKRLCLRVRFARLIELSRPA